MRIFKDLTDVSLARPDALYLMVAAGIVLAWSLINAREWKKVWAPIMRAIVLALFIFALANPEKVMHFEGAARPAVVDASNSITAAMRTWSAHLLRDQLALRADDPAVVFAGTSTSSTIGAIDSALTADRPCASCSPGATDLETALMRLAADPSAEGGPAVLVTDGWENRGDSTRAIGSIVAARIRLDIFTPPGATAIPNVAMTELSLPPALEKAEPFALGVTIENLNVQPVTGTISVSRNNTLIDTRRVTLPPGSLRFDFPVRNETAGLASYSASFKADDPKVDQYLEDDSLKGWVGVGARRKVLILADRAKDAAYLQTVAERRGFEPTVVPVATGRWDGKVTGYDVIFLDNLPASRLAPADQNSLVSYIRNGGSVAMVGGDSSFGLGGWQSTPLAAAMPVIMKPPEHKERTRALILIIDKSGSMGRNDKLKYAKAAAETVTEALKPSDLVSVIGFDSQPFVVVPLEPLAKSRPYLDQMINRLVAHGTTYMLPALQEAERTLAHSGAQIQHVVILTDGETGGTPAMYYDLVSRMHHEGGATISAIAIGREANLNLLESIAKFGGGAFYQTDSPKNLPELFVQDFRTHGGETTMQESSFKPHTVVPDPVLKDLAGRQLPSIKGYVSTQLKPNADLSAYIDRGTQREPLIASWKYGAGKALAVTTDASGRWSGPWITANVFTPVWDRLLGWMTPRNATGTQKFDVELGYQGGRINIRLNDYSDVTTKTAGMLTTTVTRPDATRIETALSEEVPGEYSGSIEAPTPGTYGISVRAPGDKSQTFPPLAYTVSPAVLAEVPRPAPNYGLLERLASATGGRLNPDIAEVGLGRPNLERRDSLNPFIIIAAMILLIGEALVRRLTS